MIKSTYMSLTGLLSTIDLAINQPIREGMAMIYDQHFKAEDTFNQMGSV
jgi:hypothetical protein